MYTIKNTRTFNRALKKSDAYTEDNYHTLAIEVIVREFAKHQGIDDEDDSWTLNMLADTLEGIERVQRYIGWLTPDLQHARKKVCEDFKEWIADNYEMSVLETINKYI